MYDTCEESITPAERKEQRKYAIMVQRPQDKKFLVQMLDESSQIRDDKKLAKRIKTLIDEYGIPKFLNKRDTFLFEIYRQFGYIFWPIAIPIIKKRDATIGVYRTQYNNNSSEYYTYIRMSWPEQ